MVLKIFKVYMSEGLPIVGYLKKRNEIVMPEGFLCVQKKDGKEIYINKDIIRLIVEENKNEKYKDRVD